MEGQAPIDLPVQEALTRAIAKQEKPMTTFNIPDMSCGHCTTAIEKALSAADASATVTFDMDARTAEITSCLDDATLTQTLASEGYPSTIAP